MNPFRVVKKEKEEQDKEKEWVDRRERDRRGWKEELTKRKAMEKYKRSDFPLLLPSLSLPWLQSRLLLYTVSFYPYLYYGRWGFVDWKEPYTFRAWKKKKGHKRGLTPEESVKREKKKEGKDRVSDTFYYSLPLDGIEGGKGLSGWS